MKKVLITGATSGIGESLLATYAQQHHQVIACGRNEEKLANYQRSNHSMQTLAFDVTKPEQVANAAADVDSIDMLILNAGDCAYLDDIEYFDGQLFAHIVQTNLVSLGYLLQYFLPKLSAGGQVVFISSSASLLAFPKAQAYGASKAGMDYLANSLRLDLAIKNIDVTLVHPGFIKTPLTDKNTFAMPFMITSDRAATLIYQGVSKRKHYLHFPKCLTLIIKALSLLPTTVWLYIVTRKAT
jgi:short-subunit dehydrogenase